MISLFLSRGRGKWEEFLFLFFGREFHSIPCDWSLKEGWWESSANKGKSYSRERARRRLKLLRFRVEIQRVAKSWLQTWRSGTWARQAVQRGRGEVCARERKRKKEEGGKEEGRPTTTKFARSTKVPWRLARKVRGPGIRSVATKNKINGSLSRTQAGCKLQEDRPLPWAGEKCGHSASPVYSRAPRVHRIMARRYPLELQRSTEFTLAQRRVYTSLFFF